MDRYLRRYGRMLKHMKMRMRMRMKMKMKTVKKPFRGAYNTCEPALPSMAAVNFSILGLSLRLWVDQQGFVPLYTNLLQVGWS